MGPLLLKVVENAAVMLVLAFALLVLGACSSSHRPTAWTDSAENARAMANKEIPVGSDLVAVKSFIKKYGLAVNGDVHERDGTRWLTLVKGFRHNGTFLVCSGGSITFIVKFSAKDRVESTDARAEYECV
jgi:hypothetical protein